MRTLTRILLLCAAVLAIVAGLQAQTFYARLTGTVTDHSKAVVPGATVTVTHIQTNVSRSTSSDESGVYNVPALPPGTYELKVEAGGFQPFVRRDVRLETNQVATADVELQVGAVAQAVEVTGEVPLLQAETSSYGSVLESNLIKDVPLLQRDIMGLVNLFPGVISGSQVGDARGSRNVFDSNFSVAGGRTSTNEVLIDGAPNTIGDFNGVVVIPPVDSVAEFRIETSSYSAEFGRSGGGVVNMVTKSGTNEWHGGVYEYLQNTALNANSYGANRAAALPANAGQASPKALVKRNQFGGTLGGPVWIPGLYHGKDRTFFFFGFEGRRERNPTQGLFTVPTAEQRRGDFSQTNVIVSGQPQLVRVFDPMTARLQPNGRYFRDQFTGNVIPQGRLNPIAQKVLSYYPEPNRPGNPFTGTQNYYFQDVQKYSRDLINGRVDHNFSERHRLFGRFSWQENLEKNPGEIVQFASTTSTLDNFRNFVIDDTYTLSARAVNNFRVSLVRYRANIFPHSTLGFDPTELGLPAYIKASANILFFPNFSIAGFTGLGGTAYNNQPRDTQGVQNQLVWTRGRHTLRPGIEYRLYRFFPYQVFNPTGAYSFGQNFTQQDHLAAAAPTQGAGLASFLLGTGSFSFEHVDPLTIYHHYVAAYMQDDWKVTPRLTLNLGLRWEMETGTAETHGRLTYFDPQATSPVSNVVLPDGRRALGALQFTTDDRPGSIREPNKRNFGPRMGFAYRVTDNMSIRGGYGIFFLPVGLESGIVTTPFNYTVSADVLNTNYTPKTTLSDPFPGGIQAPASIRPTNDGTYRLGIDANVVLRDQPAPYMQEWNFGISRQLARTIVVDATYYGSRGVHLPINNLHLNQIDSKLLERGGAYLTERVPNPFYGQISTGLLSQPTVPRMQLLKPFPQFAAPSTANAFGGSLVYYRPPVGDSSYNALTFKVEKRFSDGLSVQAHYTISKLIDIGGVGNGAAFLDVSALRDIYNIRLERSVSAWDVPQRLIVNYNWDLPFGRGRRLAKNAPGWANHIIGGWSIHSIHTWQSGRPIAVGGTDLSRLAGASPSRVDVVGGVEARYDLDVSRANARDWDPRCSCTKSWFNTAAFRQSLEFTIPNGPRFLPNVRTDNLKNWDFSLNKHVRFTEKVGLQLTGQFFNFLNQVYFGAPAGGVSATNFGSTDVASAPRRVQVGAKVNF